MPTDDTITTAEAAAILGIIRTSVPRSLRDQGIEPRGREPPRVGGTLLWPKTAVETLAATYDSSRRARRVNPKWNRRLFPEATPRPKLTAEEWQQVMARARQRVRTRRSNR